MPPRCYRGGNARDENEAAGLATAGQAPAGAQFKITGACPADGENIPRRPVRRSPGLPAPGGGRAPEPSLGAGQAAWVACRVVSGPCASASASASRLHSPSSLGPACWDWGWGRGPRRARLSSGRGQIGGVGGAPSFSFPASFGWIRPPVLSVGGSCVASGPAPWQPRPAPDGMMDGSMAIGDGAPPSRCLDGETSKKHPRHARAVRSTRQVRLPALLNGKFSIVPVTSNF